MAYPHPSTYALLFIALTAAALAVACKSSSTETGGAGGTGGTAPITASPFSCGSTQCAAGESCESSTPGTTSNTNAGPYFTCRPLAATCVTNATCTCVMADLQQEQPQTCFSPVCTDDGHGHVTVACHGA